MPVQPFHIVDKLHGKSLQDQVDYLTNELAKTQKTLRYLLNGGLDTDNVNELNAKVVNAGILNTNLVTIKAEDGSAYYLIDKNGIVANNGSENTFDFDLATGNLSIKGIITALAGMIGGWTIQDNALYSSTTSYPRIVMNPSSNEFFFYSSANQYIKFGSFDNTGEPYIDFFNGSATTRIKMSSNFSVGSNDDIDISAGSNDIFLRGNEVWLQADTYVNFDELIDNITQDSLSWILGKMQDEIDDKADDFYGYDGVVTVGDGNGGTLDLHFDNGVLINVS